MTADLIRFLLELDIRSAVFVAGLEEVAKEVKPRCQCLHFGRFENLEEESFGDEVNAVDIVWEKC